VIAPLVELVEVTKVYGQGDTLVRALAGASLAIAEGEFVAVMGPSGSGKSTCLNVIGCLDRPTSGAQYFRGVELSALSRDQLALFRRHYLGFVFQGYNLLARTSAIENVELPLVYRGVARAQRRARAQQALADVGLAGREHHAPSELSGGQQQRVAIARAIVTAPSVLLADEPTGNLDSARKDEIMRLLCDLNAARGITIIMVTHEPEMAAFARRTVHFRDGVIDRIEPGRAA
jgi:putative ABC transport system ATP-binding protein